MAGPGRATAAAISVVLATAVVIVVTLFVSGWAWPLGAALLALVATQAGFEAWRARMNASSSGTSKRWSVRQRVRNMRNSSVAGVRKQMGSGDLSVRQRARDMEKSKIVGIDGTDEPEGPPSGADPTD
ncbi:hypothetical protein Saso_61550 [Streptomyces asoensis]|uniref:Uncharacterized protein n=1 Tax=Streptomyces asoensis TaxID=249586 RepID=A0ABQ3S8Q7_9ACTN|nr:hypothetical protein GCM10010496_40600 [Streptomyces asoensis]GHI64505.1 hypothetical protein Saso_61550 [Streptomyces asoensis]